VVCSSTVGAGITRAPSPAHPATVCTTTAVSSSADSPKTARAARGVAGVRAGRARSSAAPRSSAGLRESHPSPPPKIEGSGSYTGKLYPAARWFPRTLCRPQQSRCEQVKSTARPRHCGQCSREVSLKSRAPDATSVSSSRSAFRNCAGCSDHHRPPRPNARSRGASTTAILRLWLPWCYPPS
jgi:hypothetical protein